MKKYIHYCWFGKNPLPKLANKCIKSWEKYLPDYEIMRWDETNFDIKMTDFSKKAYEAKKWAFVSDVARVYALDKFGGLYFDTDMLVTKNIDFLLKDNFFAGWESPEYVAAGVLGAKQPNNPIIKALWNRYKNLTFDKNNMYSFSFPRILTEILVEDFGLNYLHSENQRLKGKIAIYTRDYFYPLSYDHKHNMFTENTCMIHYYDASWISPPEKRLIKIYRFLGKEKGDKFFNFLRKIKKALKICLTPIIYFIGNKRHLKHLKTRVKEIDEYLSSNLDYDSLVIYNPDWLGIMYATKELFDKTLELEELFHLPYIEQIAQIISSKKIRVLVFSGFAVGWVKLAERIHELDPDIQLKTLWHGSHSMYIETYDSDRFLEIMSLYKRGILSSLGFVKKSMAEFYIKKNIKSEFVMNTVKIKDKEIFMPVKAAKEEQIRIGIYASGDRWVKNFYNQLAATSLVENALVECIPLNWRTHEFASIHGVKLSGEFNTVSREELLKRIAKNDINLYVTYSECAPILPLESLELGVPCITGNNHHYWEGTSLRDYLVVEEVDDVNAIYNKIVYCLQNKEEILNQYFNWKRDYDKEVKHNVKKFLSRRV